MHVPDESAAKIRVLHLCEHFGNHNASFHGVARSFELWVPALNCPPVEVLLCSRATPGVAALERYRQAGFEPLWLGYGKFDPRNLFKLLTLIRQQHIDILHLHGFGACTWGRIAGHLCRIPAIVHVRCNYHRVPVFQRPVEWVLGPWTRFAFAVSESTREFTVKKRHIPDSRVRCLYSGIPLDAVPAADPVACAALRREHGVNNSDCLLGVVSRLEPHKGHFDLLEALARIPDPTVKLWIVGDGYYQDAIHDRIAALHLTDRVLVVGYQKSVWPWVHALDVQVFPSHQEGTPNTLYESLAAAKTIVASTADGQGEILTDDRDALLYAPGDIDALVLALRRVLNDGDLRSRLQFAAGIRARDFDMAKTIETLRATYLDVMEKH